MESKEIEMITRINKDIQNLISDLNIVVADLGILTKYSSCRAGTRLLTRIPLYPSEPFSHR